MNRDDNREFVMPLWVAADCVTRVPGFVTRRPALERPDAGTASAGPLGAELGGRDARAADLMLPSGREDETAREDEWHCALGAPSSPPELQRLSRAGAPPAVRASWWRRASDEINPPRPAGYYEATVRRALGRGSAAKTYAKQIDKDLHRTFASLHGLRVPESEAIVALRNVLMAFAQHNPAVGYCQSMNFIAAVLLLVLDEESAFGALAALVERVMPGHFDAALTMARVDQQVVTQLLRQEDAELVTHLERLGLPPAIAITQWLFTAMVGSALPLGALLRVWDALFYEVRASVRVGAPPRACATRCRVLARSATFSSSSALSSLSSSRTAPSSSPPRILPTRTARSPPSGRRSAPPPTSTRCSTPRARHRVQRAAARPLAARRAHPPPCPLRYALPDATWRLAPLSAARRSHALALADEGGGERGADDIVATWRAAVETAAAVRARPRGAATARAAGGRPDAEWTVVPLAAEGAPGSDEGEGWSLVEPTPVSGAAHGCALSYVIMQLEQPTLREGHFAPPRRDARAAPVAVTAAERREASQPGDKCEIARGALDDTVHAPPHAHAQPADAPIAGVADVASPSVGEGVAPGSPAEGSGTLRPAFDSGSPLERCASLPDMDSGTRRFGAAAVHAARSAAESGVRSAVLGVAGQGSSGLELGCGSSPEPS